MAYEICKYEGETYVVPKAEMHRLEEDDYKRDPLAFYHEHSIAGTVGDEMHSFWGHARCKVSDKSDLIAVAVALHAAEIACEI